MINVYWAESFLDRLFGLMLKSPCQVNEPLGFRHCRSIHTFFMRCDIAVFVLDSSDRVLAIDSPVKPWRVRFYKSASHLIEVPVCRLGDFNINDIRVGEKIDAI